MTTTDEKRQRRTGSPVRGLLLGAVGALLFGAASFGVGIGPVQGAIGGLLALIGLVVSIDPRRGALHPFRRQPTTVCRPISAMAPAMTAWSFERS